jgi:hypothetical protein
MKLKKRKLKFAVIFGLCWFGLLVLLVDGVLGFQRLVGWCGSWAVVEVALWLLVLVPTAAVYGWTRDEK